MHLEFAASLGSLRSSEGELELDWLLVTAGRERRDCLREGGMLCKLIPALIEGVKEVPPAIETVGGKLRLHCRSARLSLAHGR